MPLSKVKPLGVVGHSTLNKGDLSTDSSGLGAIFQSTKQNLSTNVTIASTENAFAVGVLSVDSGVTLTVDSGARLAII